MGAHEQPSTVRATATTTGATAPAGERPAVPTATPAAPRPGKLYGSLFLHANMHYAEIPAARLPELAARSYAVAFDGLLAHPGLKTAVEFSGYTLEWLEEHAPAIIDKVRELAGRGDIEVMGSTHANPILPLIPPSDGARQIARFRQTYDRLFGDLGQPRGFYAQEYAVDASVVELAASHGFDWIVVSSGQFKISRRGLLNSALQRIPPQEEFSAAEPVWRPYAMTGARGSRAVAMTWNMPGPNDLLFAWKEGRATWAEVEGYLSGLAARYCREEDGFLLLATADTEFVGDMEPQGSFAPVRWNAALDGFASSQAVQLILPSAWLDAHPPQEEVYLKAGAGARFSDLQNWTLDPDNARLNQLSDDARHQIRLAEAMLNLVDALGFDTGAAAAELDRAQAHLLLADNSDGRGWKPLPERRLDCYNHALNARDAAVKALEMATGAVRAGRGGGSHSAGGTTGMAQPGRNPGAAGSRS